MECSSCGNKYSKIATHWSKSDCPYPKFSKHQIDILTGVLMGDGTIDDKFDKKRNPRFKVYMTNKDYLNYLYEKLSPLCTKEPYLHMSAEEVANTYSEFSESENPNDYKDQYKLQTISHPDIEKFEEWYMSGQKVWPDININETILKHLYVCDGSFNNNGHRFYAEIHLSNERKNKDKVESMFAELPFEISRWRDDKTENNRYKTSIIFNKEQTRLFFEYVGRPLPGFEYKWP